MPEPQIKAETVTRDIESVYTPANNVSVELAGGVMIKSEPEVIEEPLMSREDIELIALVTMAEAEGECEEGQRLVIDTILNRVDTKHLGDETVSEVIYRKGQFSSMWNGRVDRCEVTEEMVQLVKEELESRTNYDVMYFHAGKYGKYGTPMFSVENHYFSSI